MVLRIRCIMILTVLTYSLSVQAFRTSELIIHNSLSPTVSKSNVKAKNDIELKVEVAVTQDEHQKGLMFRKKLDDGHGMIFLFDHEAPRSFWMKNTLLPLSLAFVDANKTIFQISDLKPVLTLAQKKYDQVSSIKPAKYVIEVPKGWFLRNKISVGSKISWPEEAEFK